MPKHERRALTERFWPKVDMSGDCWEWQGSRDRKGYGRVGLGGRAAGTGLAHVASWVMAFGPVPEGMNVLHRCDNPPCVRPSHLFLGTVRDNALDALAKGRLYVQRSDYRPASRKLTDDQVREIRRLALLRVTHTEIAQRFGVHKTTVKGVIHFRSYRHVAQEVDEP